MTRFILNLCTTLILLASALSPASAEDAWLTAKYQPVAGGYNYFLTVQNSMSPSTGNYVFSIDMYTYSLIGEDLEAPPKWDANHIISDAVIWATDDGVADWADGVAPGESLSGFNVTLPGLVTCPQHSGEHCLRYRLMWYNGSGGSGLFGYAYPELVPEPSALLALAGGLGVLGLPFIRRRR